LWQYFLACLLAFCVAQNDARARMLKSAFIIGRCWLTNWVWVLLAARRVIGRSFVRMHQLLVRNWVQVQGHPFQ
jgi:hypothetical protein